MKRESVSGGRRGLWLNEILFGACCWLLIGGSMSFTQQAALLTFKNYSVKSDPHGVLSNWVNSSNPCSWKGVSCSSNGSVVALKLTEAGLSGPLFLSNLTSSLPYLITLDLSGNSFSSGDNFSGLFSSFRSGDCELTLLNMSLNNLSGNAFPRSLSKCADLETLDLSGNRLHNNIPGCLFGNSLKNLRSLSLAHNQFSGEIPPGLGQICGSLEELDLSGNRLIGGLPRTFASCTSLNSLNLGGNQLSGDFIDTVISNLPNITYLYLEFNKISGSIPVLLGNMSQLQVLDLSSNKFTGNIPSAFCSSSSSSPFLRKLLLSDNFLTGIVPAELGNCKELSCFDLNFNDLKGSIPLEVWSLPKLSGVIASNNKLTGEIPEDICINGGNLEMLILDNNFITGDIPHSIGNCSNLIWASLSNNKITGVIPPSIGTLPNLAILQLGNNSISGPIPPELGNCKSLIWLDLNSNNLNGSIPPELAVQAGMVILVPEVTRKQFAFVRNVGGSACRGVGRLIQSEGIGADRLGSHPMVHTCPSTRIYSGRTVYSFACNGSLIYLDLSYNYLSGRIPENFGPMAYLYVLGLGHNDLTGTIPDNLGDLKSINILDLSHNHLEGSIPRSLTSASFLSDFDVSDNNLTGLIPSGGQLLIFPASRYENNSGLCGLPLPTCGSGAGTTASFRTRGKKPMPIVMVVAIVVSVLFIVGLSLAVCKMKQNQLKKINREKCIEILARSDMSSVRERLSINFATYEKSLRKLTFVDLLQATNGFHENSLIGRGGFGQVYKAQLKDECTVAIKKLADVRGQGDGEFMAELETIGKIKHRNLVPLLGYCRYGEERLLVYEYIKWGSLDCVLHGRVKSGAPKLDWPTRKKIALGSARGLAFLHHTCVPHIIHRDVKSSNVLVDEDFEARVSDFGMARLVNALDSHLSVSAMVGTPGYVPPEYCQRFRCTTKDDVYSYGVILLELLSGKRPIDPSEFGDDNTLVGWAKRLRKENRADEIMDPEMKTSESDGAELHHYLKIAFGCLDDSPFRRPTMIQVVSDIKLQDIDMIRDSGPCK